MYAVAPAIAFACGMRTTHLLIAALVATAGVTFSAGQGLADLPAGGGSPDPVLLEPQPLVDAPAGGSCETPPPAADPSPAVPMDAAPADATAPQAGEATPERPGPAVPC